MMDGLDLGQAISNLTRLAERPESARGCRVSLVSFVWIDTFLHHWPSRRTAELTHLQARFAYLKSEETSRYLKQRRLVLNKLARSYSA